MSFFAEEAELKSKPLTMDYGAKSKFFSKDTNARVNLVKPRPELTISRGVEYITVRSSTRAQRQETIAMKRHSGIKHYDNKQIIK